jgi:hypothetical protein
MLTFALATTACGSDTTAPHSPASEHPSLVAAPWGPESPPFNLEAVLRAPAGQDGFGLVRFRQPNDASQIVLLDVWVRDLAPNTNYLLQRATDAVVDDDCTGVNWLTLGQGTAAQAITTDSRAPDARRSSAISARFPWARRSTSTSA